MSFRHHHAYPTVALLVACNARLAVMDEPLDGPDGGLSGNGGSAGHYGSSGAGGWSGSSGAAGSGGWSGAAGSAGAAGDGTISACGDSIQNGDETGVDCGGSCAACVLPCDCAVSEALMPLGCAELGQGLTASRGLPRMDATGDTISFDACTGDPSANPSCRVFIYRHGSGVSELTPPLGGGRIGGLSADGQHALFLPSLTLGNEALVYAPDGSSTGTGLAPFSAIMAADGSVAGIGAAKPNGVVDLMRWTSAGGSTVITELPFDGSGVELTGISSDGFTIAGTALVGTAPHGFVHDPVNGLVIDLGDDRPETATAAQVLALSGEGDAAVGLLLGGGTPEPFYWSVSGGLVALGAPADSTPGVDPYPHLSTDGNSVAVTLESPQLFSAVRWTSSGAAPLIPGGQTTARLINADGSTIIGTSFDQPPAYSMFAWTPETGARNVLATLQAAGVDVTGWHLDDPTALSADGKVITGLGQCGGARTTYRLVLPD